MHDLPALLAFWAAFALALISPGPNFALMLRIGLGFRAARRLADRAGHRRRRGGLGLCRRVRRRGPGPALPGAGHGDPLGGGLFLLWLALGALRSAWQTGPPPAAALAGPAVGGFATGLAIILLNPKAGFFWVSITGVLLGADVAAPTGALAVLVAVLLSLAWHAGLALAFSASAVTALYAKARRGIEAVLGAALAALGLKLLATS